MTATSKQREEKPAQPPPKDGDQQQSGAGEQYGEGSYSGARQYNAGVAEHMKNHDVEREARDAEPRNAAEEREMEEAERIGRSKARGESEKNPDAPADEGDRPA